MDNTSMRGGYTYTNPSNRNSAQYIQSAPLQNRASFASLGQTQQHQSQPQYMMTSQFPSQQMNQQGQITQIIPIWLPVTQQPLGISLMGI